MSDDDPFAEPQDTEKTVIKPNPQRRRTPTAPPAAPAPEGEQQQGDQQPPQESGPVGHGIPAPSAPAQRGKNRTEAPIELAITGMNVLNACASTLFSLVSRIRNRAQHMDPAKLRQSVVAEIRAFENRALQAGVEAQTVKVARYAICATLDDVVLNTPWGGQSVWTQQSMVGTFHKETVGGDRFYDLLARLEQEPGKEIDLLEFLYVCLSLGFEGRLRVEAGGSDKHLQIRNGLARIIRGQRGPVERDLSPKWKGVDRAHRPLSAWLAVWITAGVLVAVLGLGFFGLSYALSSASDRLLGQLAALDPGVVPELQRRAPPPPPPPPTPAGESQLEKVKKFLEVEIAEGIVTVLDDANTITVRIVGKGMFRSGSDVLQQRFMGPILRIADALEDEPGMVIVAGHSDNVPIRTARFPSNTHLSLARAKAVMKIISSRLSDPSRLSAEGRADKQPIASNDTREGRAKNRRIEVILVKATSG
ncbi:MAG: type IVB secretion system protein IcmH/DotU [Paracoccaceae bacterium]